MKVFVAVTPEIKEFFLTANIAWKDTSIEVDQLFRLVVTYNEKHDVQNIDVAELLATSVVVRRVRDLPEQCNDELAMMRMRAAERKYQKSIQGTVAATKINHISQDVKSASESITFATHFILAFVSAFLLGYYAGEYVWGLSEPGKYICGGAASFSTLILESALFILRDNKATKPIEKIPVRQEIVTTSLDNSPKQTILTTIRKRG